MSATDTDTEPMDKRLIFPVTDAMAEAIDDYRFAQRLGSKSEALRRLIEAGLQAEHKRLKGKG
jgi:hypothetical protein